MATYTYPGMVKTTGNFTLRVEPGTFSDSEIIVMRGEKGIGKTTFIRMLAGITQPDEYLSDEALPEFSVSYKPQRITPKFTSTVRNLLHGKIRDACLDPLFQSDVMKPLRIDELMDQEIQNLSGGDMQRVAITLCLGKSADIYLIDDPSANLDPEQRIIVAKVIKSFVVRMKRTAFVVENDDIMSGHLADRVVTFTGQASVEATASSPVSVP